MCKKYGHNTRTCTVRMRHDERQQRRRTFYREHAADTDCNLDRVMFLLCDCLAYIWCLKAYVSSYCEFNMFELFCDGF
jgi:hypothetical protein